MRHTFRTTRRVEFRDTDAAGIMHFSAYVAYMEEAEHELLRHLGLSVMMSDQEGPVSWPRVSVQCDYQGAARFEDLLEIEVGIERLGEKSVTYGFQFRREGQPLASGRMTAVCCRLDPRGPIRSIPIPDWIRDKLQPLLEP
ncbi:MAG: acyl-CoA thioesterase [Pirellulaceae bacterium]|nr:acyl-CoA thioesterase [Pirellulaceae bacterium]